MEGKRNIAFVYVFIKLQCHLFNYELDCEVLSHVGIVNAI